jgi:Ion channel
MTTVLLVCLAVMVITTVIHYEVLGALNDRLPGLPVPERSKLLVAMLAMLVAHLIEMTVWGVALFLTVHHSDVGTLRGDVPLTLMNCIYFSAETYTSLGFGDVRPDGHLRLMVGMEALNGLLLIAWSASFTYLAMERFWSLRKERHGKR